ncbi:MAG: transcriptional repressor LexA [Planctomycetaceae bacterium]|nr:transcriptional repressor LexA [Planctomycetaceae bacterium]
MTKEVRLTDRQQRVLDYIRDRIENRGYGPTVREIGDEFDIRSPNGVACHLKALEKKGLIAREANRSRAIQLTRLAKPQKGVQLRGQLVDGVLQESDLNEQVDLENILEVKRSGTFVVQVKGNTKLDGFSDGDFVIVKKSSNADKGQIVLVKVGSEVTLQRLQSDIGTRRGRLDAVASKESATYDKPAKVIGIVLGVVRPV